MDLDVLRHMLIYEVDEESYDLDCARATSRATRYLLLRFTAIARRSTCLLYNIELRDKCLGRPRASL